MKKRSERRKHCARAGCSKVRTPPARPPVANTATHPQTGPITIHCAAKLSTQCNDRLPSFDNREDYAVVEGMRIMLHADT